MAMKPTKLIKRMAKKLGMDVALANTPATTFHSHDYLRYTALKLEHLASLRIPVADMSVLEVGAGIGDHSRYYLDRGCSITITEARPKNLRYLRKRYPHCDVQFMDMEQPSLVGDPQFDITHCYGLLYHLGNPAQALECLSRSTTRMLFLETCVSFGEADELNPIVENKRHIIQAYSGMGCRPTRRWIFNRLQSLFQYVYLPKTQPNYVEFPIDWVDTGRHRGQKRAVFIASREKLDNEMLVPSLMNQQERHA